MQPLRLSFGCGDYDRTRPLVDGTLQADGIELAWECCPVPHALFVRVLDGEFDVAEMSLSGLTALVSRGDSPIIGIPVFTSRLFRHSFIFVNTDAGIEKPQDLVNRRVGVPDYTVTAALWIRGLLQHDYGVAPNQIDWFLGGLNDAAPVRPLATRLPADVRIQPIPEGENLGALLESGRLDAIISPGTPEVFKHGSPKVRRLFPNYPEVEADYYRRTGIVPIMHVVVLRRSVYQEHPWVAQSLMDAFEEAKRRSFRSLQDTGAPRVSLTWLQAHLEAERAVFGDDLWPYGLEPNRKSVEALTQYSYEQGIIERPVGAESLFATETLDLVPV